MGGSEAIERDILSFSFSTVICGTEKDRELDLVILFRIYNFHYKCAVSIGRKTVGNRR